VKHFPCECKTDAFALSQTNRWNFYIIFMCLKDSPCRSMAISQEKCFQFSSGILNIKCQDMLMGCIFMPVMFADSVRRDEFIVRCREYDRIVLRMKCNIIWIKEIVTICTLTDSTRTLESVLGLKLALRLNVHVKLCHEVTGCIFICHCRSSEHRLLKQPTCVKPRSYKTEVAGKWSQILNSLC
jgi:hypothetical protein